MAFNLERKIEKLVQAIWTRRGGLWLFMAALLRSRYFVLSLIFYLTLLLIFSGYVISTYMPIRGSFEGADQLMVLPEATPPPPPSRQQQPAASKEVQVSAVSAAKTDIARITVQHSPAAYAKTTPAPQVAPVVKMSEVKIETDMASRIKAANIQRLQNVRNFTKDWGVTGSKKAVRARFTIFKAKYQDGDWNCNPEDLANLMLQIRAWSRNRIDANLHPEVLDVGTDQLFTLKPPFVYLTGHKDFRFLDQEVQNLRDYLMVGGAVWADTALAGRRSRFDIAFRREMARVLPDREFEDVKPDHEMFNTFFDDIDQPAGINFYHEPIEMINIGNELAVLYTLNGYGHFWESRLNRQGNIEWNSILVGTNAAGQFLWRTVYGPHLSHPRQITGTLYRNINDDTVRNAYKFGINVVVHLLTRYQKYMKFLPLELPTTTSQSSGRLGAKPADAGTNSPPNTNQPSSSTPAKAGK